MRITSSYTTVQQYKLQKRNEAAAIATSPPTMNEFNIPDEAKKTMVFNFYNLPT